MSDGKWDKGSINVIANGIASDLRRTNPFLVALLDKRLTEAFEQTKEAVYSKYYEPLWHFGTIEMLEK